MLTDNRRWNSWIDPALFGRTFRLRAPIAPELVGTGSAHVRLPTPDARYNQGPIGCCVAEGLALACEIAAVRSEMRPDRPSIRWSYWHGRRAIGTVDEDSGSIGGDVLMALRRGWVSEAAYPWVEEWSAWVATPPEAGRDAPFVLNSEALPHDLDTVLYELDQGHPVVAGLRIDAGWEAPGEFLDGPRGAPTGGHLIAIVGYQREGGDVALRVRNSWGAAWGDEGEVWMPAEWTGPAHCGELHAVRVTRDLRPAR